MKRLIVVAALVLSTLAALPPSPAEAHPLACVGTVPLVSSGWPPPFGYFALGAATGTYTVTFSASPFGSVCTGFESFTITLNGWCELANGTATTASGHIGLVYAVNGVLAVAGGITGTVNISGDPLCAYNSSNSVLTFALATI